MIDITFGRTFVDEDRLKLSCKYFFNIVKKPEWFSDPLIQAILKDIDKAEVLFEEALKDRYGHGFSPEHLCTGTKTLCCLYKRPDWIYFGNSMGTNCDKFILEIGKRQDIQLVYEMIPTFPNEYFETGLIRCNGTIYTNEFDMIDEYAKWAENAQRYVDEYCEKLEREKNAAKNNR